MINEILVGIRAYLLKQGPLFINIQVLSGEAMIWHWQ